MKNLWDSVIPPRGIRSTAHYKDHPLIPHFNPGRSQRIEMDAGTKGGAYVARERQFSHAAVVGRIRGDHSVLSSTKLNPSPEPNWSSAQWVASTAQ